MAQALHSSDKDSATTAPWRVLVVDDNIPSAKTSGWTLELLGFDVAIAHSGEEALDRVRDWLPQIVLLDIGLPRMDGYEVCRRLRQDTRFADTVIIAQTGWSEEEHRKRSTEAGFDYHLVKPVELTALEKLLDEVRRTRKRQAA